MTYGLRKTALDFDCNPEHVTLRLEYVGLGLWLGWGTTIFHMGRCVTRRLLNSNKFATLGPWGGMRSTDYTEFSAVTVCCPGNETTEQSCF